MKRFDWMLCIPSRPSHRPIPTTNLTVLNSRGQGSPCASYTQGMAGESWRGVRGHYEKRNCRDCEQVVYGNFRLSILEVNQGKAFRMAALAAARRVGSASMASKRA